MYTSFKHINISLVIAEMVKWREELMYSFSWFWVSGFESLWGKFFVAVSFFSFSFFFSFFIGVVHTAQAAQELLMSLIVVKFYSWCRVSPLFPVELKQLKWCDRITKHFSMRRKTGEGNDCGGMQLRYN